MASLRPLELTLSLKPSYVPKSLPDLLDDLSNNNDPDLKLSVLNDFLLQHQEELVRIEGFREDFPQCKLLLMDAIETLKEEIKKIRMGNKEPLSEKAPRNILLSNKRGFQQFQRADLMSSSTEEWSNPNKERRLKTILDASPIAKQSSSSLDSPQRVQQVHGCLNADDQSMNYKLKPFTQPIWNNNGRISWTPELHARFKMALEFLGGLGVATPRQICDLMQVEGLNTDHVKSHLQKYRNSRRNADILTNSWMDSTQIKMPTEGDASIDDGISMDELD